jgi:hypothetical protein
MAGAEWLENDWQQTLPSGAPSPKPAATEDFEHALRNDGELFDAVCVQPGSNP